MRRRRTLLLEAGLILAAIVLGAILNNPIGYSLAGVLSIAFICAWYFGRDDDEEESGSFSLFAGAVPTPVTNTDSIGKELSRAFDKEMIDTIVGPPAYTSPTLTYDPSPAQPHISLELLGAYQGIRVGWNATFLFLELRVVTRSDRSILRLKPEISIEGKPENCELVADLSDWVLVKDVPNTYNFTAKNTQDTNLESLSMLKTITDAPLRAGIHQNRWIGIKLSGYLDNALDLISTVLIEVSHGAWERQVFSFTAPFPKTNGRRIVAANLRHLKQHGN